MRERRYSAAGAGGSRFERANLNDRDRMRRKFLLVCEGTKTEILYFDALEANKIQAEISALVSIIPLERYLSELGSSNPEKLLKTLLQNIHDNQLEKIGPLNLIDRLLDCDFIAETFNIKSQKSRLALHQEFQAFYAENYAEKELLISSQEFNDISRDLINYVCRKFRKPFDEKLAADLITQLKERDFTFDEEFDRLCLIVDRDPQSFTAAQYSSVIKICKDHNFSLFVTNPCFEFWLLLHTELSEDRIRELKNDILEPQDLKNKVLALLKEQCPGYRKNRYRAEELVTNLDRALLNSQHFASDLKLLEKQAGSNLAALITEMREV